MEIYITKHHKFIINNSDDVFFRLSFLFSFSSSLSLLFSSILFNINNLISLDLVMAKKYFTYINSLGQSSIEINNAFGRCIFSQWYRNILIIFLWSWLPFHKVSLGSLFDSISISSGSNKLKSFICHSIFNR